MIYNNASILLIKMTGLFIYGLTYRIRVSFALSKNKVLLQNTLPCWSKSTVDFDLYQRVLLHIFPRIFVLYILPSVLSVHCAKILVRSATFSHYMCVCMCVCN